MSQSTFRRRLSVFSVTLFAACLVAGGAAQGPEQSAIYMLAIDGQGKPILDVKASEIAIKEDVGPSTVVSVSRFGWPLKVTVLLDNGPRTASALVPYRTGLKKFFAGLPPGVPVSLIATAPNPRWLVRDTTDKDQIEKGVNLITIDQGFGRFSDALGEYAERLDKEFAKVEEGSLPPYLPVLVSIATTDADGSEVRRDLQVKMINSLRKYRVWTTLIMMSGGFGAEPGGLPTSGGFADGQNAQVAKAVQELTGGRYVPITGSGASALSSTILPDLAKDISLRYLKQMTQHRIVFSRAAGTSGPMRNFSLSLKNHPGVKVALSTDGAMP